MARATPVTGRVMHRQPGGAGCYRVCVLLFEDVSVVSKVIVCIVRVRMCAPAFISFVCGWWGAFSGYRLALTWFAYKLLVNEVAFFQFVKVCLVCV